jgi:hypothetical protein
MRPGSKAGTKTGLVRPGTRCLPVLAATADPHNQAERTFGFLAKSRR